MNLARHELKSEFIISIIIIIVVIVIVIIIIIHWIQQHVLDALQRLGMLLV